jgi:hypothetical protein
MGEISQSFYYGYLETVLDLVGRCRCVNKVSASLYDESASGVVF